MHISETLEVVHVRIVLSALTLSEEILIGQCRLSRSHLNNTKPKMCLKECLPSLSLVLLLLGHAQKQHKLDYISFIYFSRDNVQKNIKDALHQI